MLLDQPRANYCTDSAGQWKGGALTLKGFQIQHPSLTAFDTELAAALVAGAVDRRLL